MRMQIQVPVGLLEQLHLLARDDHRDARQQAEYYLYRAIEAATQKRQRTQDGSICAAESGDASAAGEHADAPAM